MSHILEGFTDPNIGTIPSVVINDDITEAEDMMVMDGTASRAYAIHAARLREISNMGVPRSPVAAALLGYLEARVAYEQSKCS